MKNFYPYTVLAIAVFVTVLFVSHSLSSMPSKVIETPYSTALELIEEDSVRSVVMDGDTLTLHPNMEKYVNGETAKTNGYAWVWKSERAGEMAHLEELMLTHHVQYEAEEPSSWVTYLMFGIVGCFLIAQFLPLRANPNQKIFSFMGHNAQRAENVDVSFKDVAGYDEVKGQLGELVAFLRDPKSFSRLGAELPRGTLLWGPPGTGKTHLARAAAGEAEVPFFFIGGSDFVEMFVGVGASRVRSLFQSARKVAPSIIFIDEIDAIGGHRTTAGQVGNPEREQTLNALMTEMDGFKPDSGIVILAATNRPDSLDPALRRRGRFDRAIFVGPPTTQVREQILRTHVNGKAGGKIDFSLVARLTSGMVGADMRAIVNEAALIATRESAKAILTDHFVRAIENVAVGHKDRSRRLSENDRRVVAVHEAGHAVVRAAQGRAKDITRVSIIPTTSGALGYNLNTPEEENDTLLRTRRELLEEVVHLLGGRAAEEVVTHEVTTGASDDLKRANLLLYRMVTMYGLSQRLYNRVTDEETIVFSEETRRTVDGEIQELLAGCHATAKEIVSANQPTVNRLAADLLEHEELSGEPLMGILREVARAKPMQTT
ncbi:ATP-dependent zinc metalloprotease FtsH [Candidatus Uhrbacteria bacterium]|nr:ATP-dependent zinc metalloprotease FtsH [Candidatus Uhrbacteria bacterium]